MWQMISREAHVHMYDDVYIAWANTNRCFVSYETFVTFQRYVIRISSGILERIPEHYWRRNFKVKKMYGKEWRTLEQLECIETPFGIVKNSQVVKIIFWTIKEEPQMTLRAMTNKHKLRRNEVLSISRQDVQQFHKQALDRIKSQVL